MITTLGIMLGSRSDFVERFASSAIWPFLRQVEGTRAGCALPLDSPYWTVMNTLAGVVAPPTVASSTLSPLPALGTTTLS
jgi:hypothetical protein